MKIKSSQTNLNQQDKENLPLPNKNKPKNIKRSPRKFGKEIAPLDKQVNTRSKKIAEQLPQSIILVKTVASFLPSRGYPSSPDQQYHSQIVPYLLKRPSPSISYPTGRKNKKYQECRPQLIKYLYNVLWKYSLRRKTLYLAVQFMDGYILGKDIRNQMQWALIAVSSMLIAMKYEEIYPPRLRKWTDESEDAIIDTQSKILSYMGFNLAITTAEHYIQLYYHTHLTPRADQKTAETALDLHLFTGALYSHHPAALVLDIMESDGEVRATLHKKLTEMVAKNQKIWKFLIKMND